MIFRKRKLLDDVQRPKPLNSWYENPAPRRCNFQHLRRNALGAQEYSNQKQNEVSRHIIPTLLPFLYGKSCCEVVLQQKKLSCVTALKPLSNLIWSLALPQVHELCSSHRPAALHFLHVQRGVQEKSGKSHSCYLRYTKWVRGVSRVPPGKYSRPRVSYLLKARLILDCKSKYIYISLHSLLYFWL